MADEQQVTSTEPSRRDAYAVAASLSNTAIVDLVQERDRLRAAATHVADELAGHVCAGILASGGRSATRVYFAQLEHVLRTALEVPAVEVRHG